MLLSNHDTRLPKYVRLADELRGMVGTGKLLAGEKLPSFEQLRMKYGVTRTTLDKAHGILEREGLIQRKQGLGTFVIERKPIATKTVAFISYLDYGTLIRVPYWNHLFASILDAAKPLGLQVLFIDKFLGANSDTKIDGLLICRANESELDVIMQSGIPCVSVLYQNHGISSVIADEYQGAYDATAYLISLGHRRIATLMYPGFYDRCNGYKAALLAAGIEPMPDYEVTFKHSIEDQRSMFERGHDSTQDYLLPLRNNHGCTAVLVQNDGMAMGVVDAFQDAGIDIPGQMSVIGFDGTELGLYSRPTLTSVEMPLESIGATAMRMLATIMSDSMERARVTNRVLSTRLIVRDSVGRVSSADTRGEPNSVGRLQVR